MEKGFRSLERSEAIVALISKLTYFYLNSPVIVDVFPTRESFVFLLTYLLYLVVMVTLLVFIIPSSYLHKTHSPYIIHTNKLLSKYIGT